MPTQPGVCLPARRPPTGSCRALRGALKLSVKRSLAQQAGISVACYWTVTRGGGSHHGLRTGGVRAAS